jgi:glycosyltransferase involved in cell wall biosynthesis
MSIIAVTADPLPSTGGVQNVVWHLARQYARKGYSTSALCPGKAGPSSWGNLAIDRAELPPFSLRRWLRDPDLLRREVARCRAVFSRRGAHVVHLHSLGQQALYAVLAARSLRLGTIATIHGFKDFGTLSRFGLWLERLTCQSCDTVTTCCEADRRGLLARHPSLSPRVRTLTNGVDLASIPSVARPLQRETAAYVGRFSVQKGVDVLLRAWAEVERDRSDYRLRLVGDGPEGGRLRALAAELRLRRVTWTGGLAPEAACQALAEAMVACMPSRWEGMPLVALEAMACGRPVVASDVGGLSELVVAGETGLLVPPDDPEALAGALLPMLRNPERAAAMGRAGRSRIERGFTWDRIADEYLLLYEWAHRRAAP